MNRKRPGGWIALACRHLRDPKFQRVSDAARLLWIDGLCYSGEQETDGRLPTDLRLLGGRRSARQLRRLCSELLAVGLWTILPDGTLSVPPEAWNRWQETAEQRTAARARGAKRQAQWRSRHAVSDAVSDATSGAGAGVGHSPTTPVPPSGSLNGNGALGREPWQDSAGRWFVGDRPEGIE